jgi:hypothetical protein
MRSWGEGEGEGAQRQEERPLSAAQWRESGLGLQRDAVLGFRRHVQTDKIYVTDPSRASSTKTSLQSS